MISPSNRVRPPETWQEALEALQRGNERFVNGTMDHPHSAASFRQGLEEGQHPFATIVGCSDSRVPPELIFDEGFGDLFVIRVAGNVIDTDVTASAEYGIDRLGTRLLVVLGHEGCGAVTAAVQHARGELVGAPPELLSLLSHIEPGLGDASNDTTLEAAVKRGVEDNVRHAIAELRRVDDIRQAVIEGRVHILGAIYDLHTGRVRYLADELVRG